MGELTRRAERRLLLHVPCTVFDKVLCADGLSMLQLCAQHAAPNAASRVASRTTAGLPPSAVREQLLGGGEAKELEESAVHRANYSPLCLPRSMRRSTSP